MKTIVARAGFVLAIAMLAGCNGTLEDIAPKAEKKLPSALVQTMQAQSMSTTSPIMIRIFKEEAVLEVWKQKSNGRFDLVTSYDICKWSGRLGPKFTEGDRQAPEGFYMVRPHQMNPQSQYHLAFNMGYPNAYDRAHGRTGTHLMVHGACSSAGCYSMTDPQMEQIYAFARDAFKGGQAEIQVQAFPFRMTAANMARYKSDPNYGYWTMLKEGYDHFEITKVPPKVDVCGKSYVFNQTPVSGNFSSTASCPAMTQPESLRVAYSSYQAKYEAAFAAALNGSGAKSTPAPSIAGLKEAALVADWSRRRSRGDRVTREPPSIDRPHILLADAEKETQRIKAERVAQAAAIAAAQPAQPEQQQAAAPAASTSPFSSFLPGRASPTAAPVAQTAEASAAPVTPAAEEAAAAPAPKPGLKSRLLGMFGG
jgi:murein L,D-transpeptidase YafK